jgi:hypothetical protein
MIVTIDTNKPEPGPFATDAEYVQFVMSNAALSYQAQYKTATTDEGITAAREAYNAALPPPMTTSEVDVTAAPPPPPPPTSTTTTTTRTKRSPTQ